MKCSAPGHRGWTEYLNNMKNTTFIRVQESEYYLLLGISENSLPKLIITNYLLITYYLLICHNMIRSNFICKIFVIISHWNIELYNSNVPHLELLSSTRSRH